MINKNKLIYVTIVVRQIGLSLRYSQEDEFRNFIYDRLKYYKGAKEMLFESMNESLPAKDFSTAIQLDKIKSVINDGGNNLHFNLKGFTQYRYSKFDPFGRITYGNITNWELHTILNNPNALQRTTFYRYNGSSYYTVPKPF